MNANIYNVYILSSWLEYRTHECIVKPFRSNSTRFFFLTYSCICVCIWVCVRVCYASALAFSSISFILFCYCCCFFSSFYSLIRYFQMLHHSDWMHVNARICNSLIVAIWFIICFYCYSTAMARYMCTSLSLREYVSI